MVMSVRLCSGRTGFEVTTGVRIDLISASQRFNTRVATKHILLLTHDGVEVSMYASGRMIIKSSSKEDSLRIASDILAAIGE